MILGSPKGVKLLDAIEVDARLAGHLRMDAIRVPLLEIAGDLAAAATCYRAAARKTVNLPTSVSATRAAAASEANPIFGAAGFIVKSGYSRQKADQRRLPSEGEPQRQLQRSGIGDGRGSHERRERIGRISPAAKGAIQTDTVHMV